MDIQQIRKQLNVTQDEFAQMLGIARATVNRWEQGRTQPSKMAQRLIEELLNPKITETTPDTTKVIEPSPYEEPRETKVIKESEKVISVSSSNPKTATGVSDNRKGDNQ